MVYADVGVLGIDEAYRVAMLIKSATERTPDTCFKSIMRDLREHESQLWIMVSALNDVVGCVVTRMVEFETGYVIMEVRVAATEDTNVKWDSMRTILSQLEQVALDQDCDAMRFVGRRGWGRVFHDYSETNTIFDKRLKETNG